MFIIKRIRIIYILFLQKDASALLLPPTRATHGRCVLCHLCRELWRGCAQVCTVRFRLCTVCTVCRMSWALTAVFSECFAKCAHICRMCRTLSQNSTRLGIRLTTRTSCARDQEKQLRKGFQPGEQKRALAPRSGSFSVRREKWRLFRGRPGPSGGGFGDLAKSGAPAAILINAYSGDFCHPVLSNALAQEPLVYHSGTRELFSDIFGNTSKTDGTESDIFGNFDFFDILTILLKKWKNMRKCKKTKIHMCASLRKKNLLVHMFVKQNAQICKTWKLCRAQIQNSAKCAKMCRAQNAQICSANYFRNATFALCTKTQMQISQMHSTQFFFCTISSNVNFVCVMWKLFLCAHNIKIFNK